MKQRLWCSVGIAFLLSSPSAASAQEITFNFTAVITRVFDTLSSGPFALGQTVSGSYTFSAAAVDQDPSPVRGLYWNVIRLEYAVPAANYAATATAGASPGFIEVLDNEDGVRDRYVVSMGPGQIVSGPDVAGHTLDRIGIVLRDRTTLAVSSDALPLVPPALSDFAFGFEVNLSFNGPNVTGAPVSAELTSLTLSSPVTDLLDDLVQRVISLNLQNGISDSLDAKLASALNAIDDGNERNDGAAQNAIYAFMNAVEAQRIDESSVAASIGGRQKSICPLTRAKRASSTEVGRSHVAPNVWR
jgi:hypothetical protein